MAKLEAYRCDLCGVVVVGKWGKMLRNGWWGKVSANGRPWHYCPCNRTAAPASLRASMPAEVPIERDPRDAYFWREPEPSDA